ncbi:MAG: PhnD/SsuA/transferrin family substrate-binding protein [Thioalkalivibrio sp.]
MRETLFQSDGHSHSLSPVAAQLGAQEELVLTSAPRESVQEGQALYEPLARRFGEALGRAVVYRHPGNWLAYQRDVKNDAYDIILDGPIWCPGACRSLDTSPW